MSVAFPIAQQWYLFRLAVGFLTRIPVRVAPPSDDQMAASRRYFAVVGLLVGAIAALFYAIAVLWLPTSVSVMLTLLLSVALSGGFHEDGLADTFDGIAGGYTPARRLEIMKDSRIGSYGALALAGSLMLRYLSLDALADHSAAVITALIVAAGMSRGAAVTMMAVLPYARLNDSKVEALGTHPRSIDLVVLWGSAIVPALWLCGPGLTLVLLLGLALLLALLGTWFKRRLKGYTGDCLGATQQGAELVILLLLLSLG